MRGLNSLINILHYSQDHDGIVNDSMIYSIKHINTITRVIIIKLPLIISSLMVVLQEILYHDELHDACNLLSYVLNVKLNIYVTFIVLGLTCYYIIIILPIWYLSAKMIKRKYSDKNSIIDQSKRIQCRMIIFPIIRTIFWGLRLIYQIFIILLEKKILRNNLLLF